MVDAQLLKYIEQQQHAGYTEEQIRTSLLGNGYAPADVNATLKQQQDHVIHDYAQQYARQGSSKEETITQLVQQGYPIGKVRNAAKDVFGGTTSTGGGKTGIIAFTLIALLIGAGGMYFIMEKSAEPTPVPLDREVSVSPSEIIAEILETTRQNGKDAGVQECHDRLVGKSREQCLAVVAVASKDAAVCSQITAAEIHDSCLMNFLNDDFDSICSRMKLADSKETCKSISALQGAATRAN